MSKPNLFSFESNVQVVVIFTATQQNLSLCIFETRIPLVTHSHTHTHTHTKRGVLHAVCIGMYVYIGNVLQLVSTEGQMCL